jgi:carboxymethylenebutenolidase
MFRTWCDARSLLGHRPRYLGCNAQRGRRFVSTPPLGCIRRGRGERFGGRLPGLRRRLQADYESGGQTIRAEFCEASASTGRAVVVLHGCGGFSTFDHRLATELPARGISTLDVDYFARTPPPGTKGFCDVGGTIGDAFPIWLQVVRDAAQKLRATRGVDPKRIGVVGWSLGGAVAVLSAAGPERTRAFAAVAGFSTGPFSAATIAAELPPTILLSGGRTDAIPLAETLPLYDALKAAHVPSALYVYPGGSHNWPGRQGMLGIERAAAFLDHYLR